MIAKEIHFPKFPPEIYGRIALNDLVTYSVYFLSQSGGEINAEDIVAACFKLFPQRFQLRGYSESIKGDAVGTGGCCRSVRMERWQRKEDR
jgi:hypothetical protein